VTFLSEAERYELQEMQFYDPGPQEEKEDVDFLLELALTTEMFPNNTMIISLEWFHSVTEQNNSGWLHHQQSN
jgi:hypothetical protein